MIEFFKDILAPKKCYSCNEQGHFLCEKCFLSMSNFDSICYVCKGKTENFSVHKNCQKDVYYDKVLILSHYKNSIISKLIKDLKFYGKKDIGEDFGYLLSELFFNNEVYKNTSDYILVFPPMGFFKKLNRGYNHSEIITRKISKCINIPIQKSIIKKVKSTRQQSKLKRIDRLDNLKDSFKINKKYIDNIDKKIVLIVDDVISTGTTINEMSKVLKESGAKKVIGLIVASD